MSEFDVEVDASGLNCPLPLLKARKALAGLTTGKVLRVIATDPGAPKDFEAFCRHSKAELLQSSEETGKYILVLKKG